MHSFVDYELIVRARYGATFPYSQETFFVDVPVGSLISRPFNAKGGKGMTIGCTATAYCPDDSVFLLR